MITEALVLVSNSTGYVRIQAIRYLACWGLRFFESNIYVLSKWIEEQPTCTHFIFPPLSTK